MKMQVPKVRLLDHETFNQAQDDYRSGMRLSQLYKKVEKTTNEYNYFINLGISPLRIVGLHRTLLASIRCSDVALCCELFRLEQGRWPNSWEELIPKYLKEIPDDTFRNEKLLFLPLPDGLVIYSVGHNGVDDGGNLPTRVDKGVRLYSPEKRGIVFKPE